MKRPAATARRATTTQASLSTGGADNPTGPPQRGRSQKGQYVYWMVALMVVVIFAVVAFVVVVAIMVVAVVWVWVVAVAVVGGGCDRCWVRKRWKLDWLGQICSSV